MEISQNFVAFSEYMNFTLSKTSLIYILSKRRALPNKFLSFFRITKQKYLKSLVNAELLQGIIEKISFYACLLCKIFFLYACKLSSKVSLVSPQVCLHVWQSPFATSKKHDSRATARPSLEVRTCRNLHPYDIYTTHLQKFSGI